MNGYTVRRRPPLGPAIGSLRRLYRDDRGVALIFYTLMLVGLLGVVAMVTDTGLAYANRRLLQNAVDAASLAGAAYLPSNRGEALTVAQTYANDNGVTDAELSAVTNPAYQLQVTKTYNQNDTIIVSAQRNLTGGLRYLFGAGDTPIVATSSAIVAATNPQASSQNASEGIGTISPWAVSLVDQPVTTASEASSTQQPCTTYLTECLLMGGPHDNYSGNRGALDLSSVDSNPPCGGACAYSYYIEHGYTGPVPSPSGTDSSTGALEWSWSVPTKPGVMKGPTSEVDQLLTWDASKTCKGGSESCASLYTTPPSGASFDTDTSDGTACYTDVRCPRVAVIPLISNAWTSLNGKKPVNVVDFACFYITRYNSSTSELDGMFLQYCRNVGATPLYGYSLGSANSIGGRTITGLIWR
jgi:Flp pilus assembly protein TadG